MPTQWSEAEQVPLGCIAPHTAPAVSFRASPQTGMGIGSPHSCFHASGGLFSFNGERKEEKKRRQKLRFWISLRAFARRLSCLFLPRERCAMQTFPKYCIVSASWSAAAFSLKYRRTNLYRGRNQRQRRRRRGYPFDRTIKSNSRDRAVHIR